MLVHGVINLWYYEHWTDTQKCFYVYTYLTLSASRKCCDAKERHSLKVTFSQNQTAGIRNISYFG